MDTKVILGILVIASIQYATKASLDEVELVKKLLDPRTYNKNIFPQPPSNESVLEVKLGISFVSLAEINGKEGYMTSSLRYMVTWNDPRFKFNGVNSIVPRVSERNVWKPSLQLSNAYDKQPLIEGDKVLIYPETGNVLWVPKVLAKTSCNVDAYYFPFDEQTCTLKIVDRVHTVDELRFSFDEGKSQIQMKNYIESGTWTFVSSGGKKNVYKSESKLEPATEDLTFHVTFQRNAQNYCFTLVIPLILISIISILSFPLPTDCTEKLVLGFVSIVSLILLLIDMGNVIPPSAYGIPLVTKYAVFLLVLNVFTVLATIVVLQLASKGSDVPQWIRNTVLTKLGKIVLITENKSAGSEATPEQKFQGNHVQEGDNGDEYQTDAETTILNTLHKKKIQNERNESWKTVAAILDRTLFIFFALVAVVGMTTYLLSAKGGTLPVTDAN